MKIKDLAKLKKEKTPKQIIGLYTHRKINLTDKQLTEILKLKNKEHFN